MMCGIKSYQLQLIVPFPQDQSPSRSIYNRPPTSYYASPVWTSRPSPSCAIPDYASPVRSPVRVTLTRASSAESTTGIPGPTTVPSSPRTPARKVSAASSSGSPIRKKSNSGPVGRSQAPIYEQWVGTGAAGSHSKGTGTSDHPELLLPEGWEEAMADMAKDKKEIEADEKISVTVKDNKVCTSI